MAELNGNNSLRDSNRASAESSRSHSTGSGSSHAHGGDHHHHHHSGSKKHKRNTLLKRFTVWCAENKKLLYKIGGVALTLIVIVVLVVLISVRDTGNGEESIDNASHDRQASLYYNDAWYKENTDLEIMLVLGIDKTSDQAIARDDAYINYQQNDFNALVIIDHAKQKYDVLQLNRDTMTEVKKYGLNSQYTGSEIMQLALAHTYGTGGKDSCRNAIDAVQNLLYGIHIDHYVAFTMDAVPVINDAVGGVTVTIEDDFGKINSRFVKGREVTLEGEEALQYVQSRGGMEDDATNLARMRRQRTYLSALQKVMTAKMKESSSWAVKTLRNIVDCLTSDMGYIDIADLLDRISDYRYGDILSTEGTTKTTDYVEYYVDEEALKKEVIRLFYVKAD